MDLRFSNERLAEVRLEELLSPKFRLIRQVHMKMPGGRRRRIDYIAVPRCDFPVPLFGIEVKRGGYEGGFKEFTAAIKQAHDYQISTFCDKRARRHDLRPPWVFVFPECHAEEEFSYLGGMIGGAERLAGRLFVGVLKVGTPRVFRESDYWFEMCAGRVWHSVYGTTVLGQQLAKSALEQCSA